MDRNQHMKRRDFIKTSLTATSLAALNQLNSSAVAAESRRGGRPEYYELRTYHLDAPGQKDLVDSYLEKAAIPAFNRLGCRPVGAFTPLDAQEVTQLHVLIPYPTIQLFGTMTARLAKDAEYQQAATDYLQAPKAKPAYARIESSFMIAFTGMPRIELQPFSVDKKPRMFELRVYEAHSEFKCQKKVQMFNSGEMDVMRQTGMAPVFYGYSLIGTKIPNMTYMLSAENMEEHKKHWSVFGAHPEWKRLQGLAEYADTVSHITNTFLAPTAYSQI